jgi:uncharacterized protein YjbI with pentapeptide repeats
MRLFFRRSSAGTKPSAPENSGTLFPAESSATATAELPPPVEEAKAPERAVEVSLAEKSQPDDSVLAESLRSIVFAPKKDLVKASELPSAANVLAELFADAPVDAADDEKASEPVLQSAPPAPAAPEIQVALNSTPTVEPKVEPKAEAKAKSKPKLKTDSTPTPAQAPQQPHAEEITATVAATPIEESVSKLVNPLPALQAVANTALAEPAPVAPAETTDLRVSANELAPEDAATVLAAASEELRAEESFTVKPRPEGRERSAPGLPLASLPGATSDWGFEETLASHREWIESKGVNGTKADLANAELDGVELISVNLRLADLHYANLKSADLLLADLRDACMVRADLEEACLVGANLEGANLEGASLETALGLVPRQLAGTNLREASLPSQIAQFPALAVFQTASRTALRFFSAMMTLSVLSAIAVWKTKDIQLVTDSAILPFLHSPKAAAALPSAEIFLIAPVVLFLIYLAFLAQVQRIWGAALELPAVFPDGSSLGEKESGIILGLLRAHFRWMNHDAPSNRALETTVSMLAAYWIVPAMLFLFWARYLTVQEIHGTILHELLAAISAGVALHATFKVGRPQETWTLKRSLASRLGDWMRTARPPVLVGVSLAIATFFSFGTIAGAPHDHSRAPQYGAANIRRWAPTVFWGVGYDPFADLTEAQISTPPAGWNWSDETVGSVRGVKLNDPRFRYAQAYGAFLANAHLWHADFRGAYLSDADFRSADLTQSSFQFAIMDGARMNHANLDRATVTNAHLARIDFRNANLSYANLTGTYLMDARFDGASLYDASLSNTTLIRATFNRTDLRNAHIDRANLEHADLRQAYLWSTNVQGSDLKDADLGSAILIGASLRNSDLSGAHFAQTVLNETDLTGAVLDNADMRGAFGLTAYQVCTAKSHANTLFDDSLVSQVLSQCLGH